MTARGRRGFTLAEAVLVAAILGVLVGSIMQLVRGARRGLASVRLHLDAAAHARRALRELTRDLANVASGAKDAVFAPAAAAAGPGGLSLVVASLDRDILLPGPDRSRVEYRMEPDAEDGPFALVRLSSPLSPERAEPIRERVAARLRSLTFRFHDGKKWSTDWAAGRGVPRQVELTFAVQVDPGVLLPVTTIVSPGISGPQDVAP